MKKGDRHCRQSELEGWDQRYLWHPFTQMRDYCAQSPLIIERGEGSFLYDIQGNRYLDGVSSLWVNVHGHRREEIDRAIISQVQRISHSTLLGIASVPAILLAKKMADIAPPGLSRIFYSDDGSTAVEIALKMVHVDALATNVSIAYTNAEYISDALFPVLPVAKQSGIIAQINQSAWYRDSAQLRSPATKSVGGGYTVDNTTKYFCDRFSYGHEVPDEVRDNADQPYDQDRLAVRFVTDKLLMAREVAFASNLFAASVWATDQTISVVWSNYSGSSPLTEIQSWRDALQGSLGRDPNTFVIGREVWTQLKYHPDIIDMLKYTSPIRDPHGEIC